MVGVGRTGSGVLQPLVIPDLEALLVEPQLTPIMRVDAYTHPLIQHDRGAAPVAAVAGPRHARQLDRVVVWKPTVPQSSLDELSN